MNELEIVVSKVQHPSGLPSVELLCLFEKCEVFVISENLHWG